MHVYDIEKMGDINLDQVNDNLIVVMKFTNLHGWVGLTKPWMALIQSLSMSNCYLEAGDISVIADNIQACTSPTGAESASPCRLQKLDLSYNSLTGDGADIARIIPLCTEIDLSMCNLEAGDISAMADNIQACTSPTGAGSATPGRLQKLDLSYNSLTGDGADIARIIPLCTEICLFECKLEAGDISDMADSIQACTSPTGAELEKLNLNSNSLTGAGADIARIIKCIPLCTEIDLGGCKLEAGDISVIADSIQACTSPIGAESASPCRLLKLKLYGNSLTGAGADIARIIPLCTEIDLSECKLEAGDISAIADSIQACTSPTEAESASPCRLQKLDLSYNSLKGAGADIARIIECLPVCIWIILRFCMLEAGDISAMVKSIQAYNTSVTGAESASPCRLLKLGLSSNSLTGAGADIAKIIPLCTEIYLAECKLEAGDISAMAESIQACTSPTGAESASPCRLQKLDLRGNRLTGAGADIARIISCIPLCTFIFLGRCDLNDKDFHAIVNAIIQTHSDRHTSVHDHSTPDRRQTSRIKPVSPGPASHIERLDLHHNKFSDIETVRLLCDNLPPSLRELFLSGNQFNKEEIRRKYEDKHPNLDLDI